VYTKVSTMREFIHSVVGDELYNYSPYTPEDGIIEEEEEEVVIVPPRRPIRCF